MVHTPSLTEILPSADIPRPAMPFAATYIVPPLTTTAESTFIAVAYEGSPSTSRELPFIVMPRVPSLNVKLPADFIPLEISPSIRITVLPPSISTSAPLIPFTSYPFSCIDRVPPERVTFPSQSIPSLSADSVTAPPEMFTESFACIASLAADSTWILPS